jgi:hypothetical protein
VANVLSRNYFPSVPRPPITTRARDLGPRAVHRGVSRVLVVAATVVALGACRSPAPAADPATVQQAARPLASLATQPVALLPAQTVRGGDSTGWSAQLGPVPAFLRSLDSAIAAELADRGTARTWVMAEALGRSAKRNPAFTSDPYALSAESLRHGVRRTHARLGEPLASQVRSLIALTEARYALVPVELRFEPAASGAGRAILRLVLIDARRAEIQWAGDVSMEDALPSVPDIVATLADRVADLLVAP